MMRPLLAATAAVFVLPGLTRADDYYLTVYSAQKVPFRPKKTHTFVAAVHVPSCVNGYCPPVEMTSISWVPASLRLRGLTLRPEPGTNLGIPETLAWAASQGMRVSAWGPYQIQAELFYRLQHQAAVLNSGQVMYKPTDNLFSPSRVANCYHAIWVAMGPYPKTSGAFNPGDAAGGKTVELASRWIVNPQVTYPQVMQASGVAGYPVVPRAFDDRPTRRDAIRSFLRR